MSHSLAQHQHVSSTQRMFINGLNGINRTDPKNESIVIFLWTMLMVS